MTHSQVIADAEEGRAVMVAGLHRMARREFPSDVKHESIARHLLHLKARRLQDLPIYVVYDDPFALIDSEIDDDSLDRPLTYDGNLFAADGGVFWFPDRRPGPDDRSCVRALEWMKFTFAEMDLFSVSTWVDHRQNPDISVGIFPTIALEWKAHMSPQSGAYFHRVADPGEKDSISERERLAAQYSVEFLYSAVNFMAQRILVLHAHATPRAARKRAQRAGRICPADAFTIQLRRPELHEIPRSRRDVCWSHRWVVHAHTRRQWFASLGRHQEIQIDGYVKGPPDKPLILKKRNYAVSR